MKLKKKSAIPAVFLLTAFLLSIKILARPPEVNKYFSQADEEVLSGKYDKAIANYLKGMMFTTRKTEAEVFDDLGYAYLQKKELEKGKIDEAIKILEKSLVVNEQSFLLNHNLALLYFDKDKIEKAETYCARALWYKDFHKVSKDDAAGCHDLMGNIFYHQRRHRKSGFLPRPIFAFGRQEK